MLSQFVKHITDIAILTRNFSNIQFVYSNRDANKLADKIAKQDHCTLNNMYHCFSK